MALYDEIVRRLRRQKESPALPRGASVTTNLKGNSMTNVPQPLPVGKVWSEVVLVTPAHARHLRDTCHFERQRNLSKRNIDRLSSEMTAGRFISGTQIFLCVLPDRSMVLVNGNHTLESVIDSGLPQWLTLTYLIVTDLDHAARIYARFDIHKARTWADALRAIGVVSGRSAHWVSAANSGIGIALGGFRAGKERIEAKSRDVRAKIFLEYEEAIHLMTSAVADAPNTRLFRRGGVMSVALETFRYQATSAIEFWSVTAKDDGLRNGQPEKALLRYLQRITGASGGRDVQLNTARACALAWNAHFRGREISALKVNAFTDFRIAGTPWRNGRNPMAEEYLPMRRSPGGEGAQGTGEAQPRKPLTGTGLATSGNPVAMFMGVDDADD